MPPPVVNCASILTVLIMHTQSTNVKSKKVQQGEMTRKALLDAARTLFGERGYGATSLDEVAQAAKVTKGALYHHFEGKQELFAAVYDRSSARSPSVPRRRSWSPTHGRTCAPDATRCSTPTSTLPSAASCSTTPRQCLTQTRSAASKTATEQSYYAEHSGARSAPESSNHSP